jgi:hypothetical protein
MIKKATENIPVAFCFYLARTHFGLYSPKKYPVYQNLCYQIPAALSGSDHPWNEGFLTAG